MKSFSQLGQDLWVLSKYPKTAGYFIDIGFSDGINMNNTYLLELNGWRGIGIDPCAKNFQSRTNTIVYPIAVYSSAKREKYAITNDTMYSGIVSKINCHRHFLDDPKTIITTTDTQTIETILTDAKSPDFIHYLSLDTEGSEYDILNSFPFDRLTIGCISVEHNFIQPQRQMIRDLLIKNGYLLDLESQWDDFFVHKNYDQF